MILMGIIIETFQSIINSKKKSGDNKGLRRYLFKLLTERPEDYYIWAELSSVCYVLDKYNEALTYAQKSYQIAPEDYWVRYVIKNVKTFVSGKKILILNPYKVSIFL